MDCYGSIIRMKPKKFSKHYVTGRENDQSDGAIRIKRITVKAKFRMRYQTESSENVMATALHLSIVE
jgi:hypothetical protein